MWSSEFPNVAAEIKTYVILYLFFFFIEMTKYRSLKSGIKELVISNGPETSGLFTIAVSETNCFESDLLSLIFTGARGLEVFKITC